MTTILIIIAVLVTGMLAVFAWDRDAFWERIAGPADLGRHDFTLGKRRPVPNDALACSPSACNGQADVTLPEFDLPPDEVVRRVASAIMSGSEPAKRVDDGRDPAYARFVIRTAFMSYPDTLDVEAVQLAANRSGLRLYSRSKLGRNDLGANKARLERIAGRL